MFEIFSNLFNRCGKIGKNGRLEELVVFGVDILNSTIKYFIDLCYCWSKNPGNILKEISNIKRKVRRLKKLLSNHGQSTQSVSITIKLYGYQDTDC